MNQQPINSVLTTMPSGTEHLAPAWPIHSIARLDVFQRACSGYHTLEHIAWTLTRIGHADIVCAVTL